MLTVPGKWTSGKIHQGAFPLSRSPIKLGTAFRWRIDELEAHGRAFRLLTFFRTDTEKFGAWFAEDLPGGGLVVIARLEDHGTHPGLHIHAPCDPSVTPPVGRQDYDGLKRIPRRSSRRRGAFTEGDALSLSHGFFKVVVPKTPGGLL